jgi:hypothetical protein
MSASWSGWRPKEDQFAFCKDGMVNILTSEAGKVSADFIEDLDHAVASIESRECRRAENVPGASDDHPVRFALFAGLGFLFCNKRCKRREVFKLVHI